MHNPKIYLFFVISQTLVYASLKNGFGNLKWGKRLIGKMLTISQVSVLDCAEECLTWSGCWSFNYRSAALFCELNYDSDQSSNANISDQLGWIFSSKETWPSELIAKCQDSTCELSRHCRIVSSNSIVCTRPQCHPQSLSLPRNIKTFQSNTSVYAGDSQVLECAEGYNQTDHGLVKCLWNGSWSTVNITCYISDCGDVPLSEGEELTDMANIDGGIFPVTCLNTGGYVWMMIQRRMDGSFNFFRGWIEYKNGFGDLHSEFWIGLDNIHLLVINGFTILRVELEEGNETAFAEYSSFYVAGEEDKYRIHVSGYSGTAGDGISCAGLYCNNDAQFSTYDNDNDLYHLANHAILWKGAWWYNKGHRSNLNGEYGNNKHGQGVNWYPFKGNENSLTGTRIMLRRP